MVRHSRRHIPIAAATLGLLLMGGSASAAGSRPALSSLSHTTTLTHTDVERLLGHGERLRLTSTFAEKTEVRLFVYGRALDRGGQRPREDAAGKVWISPNTHVIFNHPGVQWVTLHVNRAFRTALLRAGTVTEGYFYAGYQLIPASS